MHTTYGTTGVIVEYQRLAGSVYLELNQTYWDGYFDVYALDPVNGDKYVTRCQANFPGVFITGRPMCILSGDMWPSATHVRVGCLPRVDDDRLDHFALAAILKSTPRLAVLRAAPNLVRGSQQLASFTSQKRVRAGVYPPHMKVSLLATAT